VVDAETVILGELESLAPSVEVPVPDWQQVRRRLEPVRPLRSRRRVRLAVGLAAAALVVVAAASAAYLAARAGAPNPVTNGELVIDSAPGGVAQLSTVRTDGRLRTLWRCPRTLFCGSPGAMSWSPDGKQLAFVLTVLNRGSRYAGLNVLNVRTARLTHLSSGKTCDGTGFALAVGADWSPSGRWIAFTCGSSKILLKSATGARERIVETGLANVQSPSWSPDGRRLVFSAGAVDHSTLYVINADGTHRRLLVHGGRAPAWSPNSNLIAYRGGTHGSSCGGLRLVDANTGRDASPASAANSCHQFGVRETEAPEWSPDGTEIAFGSRSGVYVINADGTDLRHINSQSPYSGRPAWRPAHGKQTIEYGARAENCRDC
jgi:Tol biopolymer transport system component